MRQNPLPFDRLRDYPLPLLAAAYLRKLAMNVLQHPLAHQAPSHYLTDVLDALDLATQLEGGERRSREAGQ
jgi:hypothetical protein